MSVRAWLRSFFFRLGTADTANAGWESRSCPADAKVAGVAAAEAVPAPPDERCDAASLPAAEEHRTENPPAWLSPTPWTVAKNAGSGATLRLVVPAPEPIPFSHPRVYGRESLPPLDIPIADPTSIPQLSVVDVSNVLALPSHVLIQQEVGLLPQSFMRGRKEHHAGLKRMKKQFRLRRWRDLSQHDRLETPAYFSDTDYPATYGHVLMEALPRLWAFDRVDPDRTVVSGVALTPSYVKMLTCLNVNLERYVHLKHPLLCDRLLIPSVPVVRREYIHPVAWETFARLGTLAEQSSCPVAERIYLSRSRAAGRELRNEAEIEQIFADRGFLIVHPQDLAIEDQVRLFANARLIAGSGGSAMHNAVFARPDARVLIVSVEEWVPKLDMMINRVPGQLGYVFGEYLPRSRPARPWWRKPWHVDAALVEYAIREHFDL